MRTTGSTGVPVATGLRSRGAGVGSQVSGIRDGRRKTADGASHGRGIAHDRMGTHSVPWPVPIAVETMHVLPRRASMERRASKRLRSVLIALLQIEIGLTMAGMPWTHLWDISVWIGPGPEYTFWNSPEWRLAISALGGLLVIDGVHALLRIWLRAHA